MQDFGKGWTNLTANSKGAIASFWDFDWGATIHRSERRAFPDETILATVYERADQMKGLTPGWDKDMHFVHSTDFFKSAHTRLVACGNQFELIGHKVSGCRHKGLQSVIIFLPLQTSHELKSHSGGLRCAGVPSTAL